jgi:hypothetical protein
MRATFEAGADRQTQFHDPTALLIKRPALVAFLGKFLERPPNLWIFLLKLSWGRWHFGRHKLSPYCQ